MKPINSSSKGIVTTMLFPVTGKTVLYLFLALLCLSVFYYTELPLISVNDAAHRRLLTMIWLIFPHAFCGFAALVLGPFQFSGRLRKHSMVLHRKLGKLYIIAILIGGPLAVIISRIYSFPGSTSRAQIATIAQAVVWIITTLVAYIAARKGQIALHKIWMSRSYGVTLIFIFSRLLNPIPAYFSADNFSTVLWSLIAAALIIPELLLNRKELFMSKKKKQGGGHLSIVN